MKPRVLVTIRPVHPVVTAQIYRHTEAGWEAVHHPAKAAASHLRRLHHHAIKPIAAFRRRFRDEPAAPSNLAVLKAASLHAMTLARGFGYAVWLSRTPKETPADAFVREPDYTHADLFVEDLAAVVQEAGAA